MFDILKNIIPLTTYPYQGERIACPVCATAQYRPVAKLDRRFKRLPTVICEGCGLLYTNPMPTEAELSHYYRRFYRFDYQLAISKPSERHRRKRRVEAARRIRKLPNLLAPGATALDFGCGSGEFVEQMVAEGFDAHGFEPGETYGADARARLGDRVSIRRWEDVSVERPYDLVTCFHVMEHLRNPLDAIAAMVGWIKPSGRIWIEVPDLGSPPFKGYGSFHFAHVVGFNTWNLRLAAARRGLAVAREFGPTSLLFERRELGEAEQRQLMEKGASLGAEGHLQTPAGRNYLAYQFDKLRAKPAVPPEDD